MISEKDLKIIHDCAEEYEVKEVILFGSALRNPNTAHDIDIGVFGVKPELFFSFYGELLMRLGKPIDVVDLSEPSKFTDLILKRGRKIYG